MKLLLSTAFLTSSVAISSAFQTTSFTFAGRKSSTVQMSDAAVDEVAPKPLPMLQDPMGLYPVDSEERMNGQIKSIEAQAAQPNTIYDPLNLYPNESEERKNGLIKSIEPEVVLTKAVVDPMNIYSNDARIDSDAIMSESLPFLTRPVILTGQLAGDVGFDPFNFAKSEADLMNYREAEIKHARLAMLAAAGWPLSEVFDKKIALALHMTPLVDAADRAPSLLNGGLGKVNPFYWMACIAAASAIEFYGINKSKSGDESYFPGNLGFDPLGMYPKEEEGQQRMQLAEIKNGRLAMIAIFGFAVQEFISKSGVVDETPFFFLPLAETLKMYTNSGYSQ